MLSINTNLSSLIAQSSLTNSTNKLNQAIERMTTGFKINHAKDNAANYSIAQNISIQISSYGIAADNVNMGMDLITTASDVVSTMQDYASRLQALSTQARNGTYGSSSMQAINSEANAIIAELTRLYNTSEYNGTKLFSRTAYDIAEHLPQAGESGFIDESADITMPEAKVEYRGFIENPKTYTDAEVAVMTRVKDVSTFTSGEKYAIYTKEELVKLADYVNSGKNTTNVEFVLGADIDLSSIANWTPIGDYSTNTNYKFKGKFDGNGHIIENLKIDTNYKYQGLFGYIDNVASIKNLGVKNCSIKALSYVGGIVAHSVATLENCYVTGTISGNSYVGGIAGKIYTDAASGCVKSCYSSANIIGTKDYVGGLVGYYVGYYVINSYATGDVVGDKYIGGLIGYQLNKYGYDEPNACYSTGNVKGRTYIGGLVGTLSGRKISNVFATGNVEGESRVGGLVGECSSNAGLANSYATGDVNGSNRVGGLVGKSEGNITTSYATGDVSSTGNFVGGLVGLNYSNVRTSYALGDVSSSGNYVGGLIGSLYDSSNVVENYSTGNVMGNSFVGGLIGQTRFTSDSSQIKDCICYGLTSSIDQTSTGNFIGGIVNTSNGTSFGEVNITNCQSVLQENNKIGGCFNTSEEAIDYDITEMLDGIEEILLRDTSTTLQVGITADSTSQINFDTNFELDIKALKKGLESDDAQKAIYDFINLLSKRSTELGAIENRLDSALDTIAVSTDNLTSSLSTIRDVDMAKVSSEYIRMQILQQASATLLATANQSPSIALQLI